MNTHATTTPGSSGIDVLLAGHALGDLEEEEREQLAVLLRERPELRGRLKQFSTTLELLPLALPATALPPAGLRRRLLQHRPQPEPRWPWLMPALLAAGLLLLGGELHQTRQQLAVLQRQLAPAPVSERRMLPLQAVQPGQRASGEVLVTGNPTHNMLMLDDLPALPPHHTYRLWATVKGRTVGCVHFVPNARGQVAMPIPLSPTSEATDVSVSVEGDPTGQAPRGPMVLTSSH